MLNARAILGAYTQCHGRRLSCKPNALSPLIKAHQQRVHLRARIQPTTWKLAAMNKAIRGIDYDRQTQRRQLHPAATSTKDGFHYGKPAIQYQRLVERILADDPRWAYGTPPKGNANFAWLQP
ncbi:MAG: N-6 DNA methylase [Haemophilus parainfluenzae]